METTAVDPLMASRSKLAAVLKQMFPQALPDWLNTVITALLDALTSWLASCGIAATPANINALCLANTWRTQFVALRKVRAAFNDHFGPGEFYANHGDQCVQALLTAGKTATAAEIQPVIDLAASDV